MAVILDGKALAEKIKEQVHGEVSNLASRPGLAVILVGNDPASRIYVNHKKKDCEACGIYSEEYALPAGMGETALLELIGELNKRRDINGILVQKPLPEGYDEDKVIEAIDPMKDVDAFHPYNTGLIMIGKPRFLPCTPAGVMELLNEHGIDVAGKRCVVVGRSNIAGKPQAMLLLQRDGTVTICHSKTKNLSQITAQADILVSAVGKQGLITAGMVKEGAVVIDVAMNKKPDGKLCGDVVFDEVFGIASYITPVPGGVGPMTRAVLMKNTLLAAKLQQTIGC